jgi:Flp pilus assembly protein TadD
MRRNFRAVLTILSLTAISLAGCADNDPLDLATPRQQAVVQTDPRAGNVPASNDDLAQAKEYFRQSNFGLAEKLFRRAVETSPTDAEAWLGLAATHDELGRFDLADREYAQVVKRTGLTTALLNNRGYSYMLRGDLVHARRDFDAARRRAPDNAYLLNNLKLLDEKTAGRG